MGYKQKFFTIAELIQKNYSGLSKVKCDTCKKVTTNAQLSYSMRFFGKPLCRSCQSLERYRTSRKRIENS